MDIEIIYIIAFLVVLGLIIIDLILWFRKNNIQIDLSALEDGTFKVKTGRFRVKTMIHKIIVNEIKLFGFIPYRTFEKKEVVRLVKINDFRCRFPFPLDYDEVKAFFIGIEGNPFIGTKRLLNVKRINYIENDKEMVRFICWIPLPDLHERKSMIDDYTYSWVLKRKVDVYEQNRQESLAQVIEKVAIPIGLIILAVILIIFMPKILDKIQEPLRTLSEKMELWFAAYKGNPPPG